MAPAAPDVPIICSTPFAVRPSVRRRRSGPCPRRLTLPTTAKTVAPAVARTSPPPAAACHKPHEEEKHDRADRGVDDQGDSSHPKINTQCWQQPIADERADNPDYQVSNEPEPDAPDDFTGQPACHN